jgi:hypothetical protein
MQEFPNKFAEIIIISTIPDTFQRGHVSVNPKECFLNAHRLATAIPGMTIIEGILLGIHETGAKQFYPHVWNKLENQYFDITGEMILAKSKEISRLVHAPAFEYTIAEFSTGSAFEFQKETIKAADDLNTAMEEGNGQS